jgi:hypothetical protein
MTTLRPGNYLSMLRLILAFLQIGKNTYKDNLWLIRSGDILKIE